MRTRISIALWLALLFTSAASASVECLSGATAQNTFVADDSEPYFSLLQPREMAAKLGFPPDGGTLARQRAQARTTYHDAVLDCTPAERKGLEGYLAIVDANVGGSYPGLVRLPWRFVKIKDEIEGGLPHTRGNVIVLSASMMAAIANTAQAKQWRLEIMEILVHEQVHVLQRSNAQPFEALYSQWGFRKANTIIGAEAWLAAHQIVNPDGIDVQWVWPVPNTSRVIWPRVILAGENATPAMPEDFRMVGVELVPAAEGYSVSRDTQGTPRYHELSDEAAYMEKFSGITSLYHPNEIAADYLAGLAVWDALVDKSKATPGQLAEVERGFKPVRDWARQVFGQ